MLTGFLLRCLNRAQRELVRLAGVESGQPVPSGAPRPLDVPFTHIGFCDICERKVVFRADNAWFRDHLFCTTCGSIPRERAIMRIIKQRFPDWTAASIHESSPGRRAASLRLSEECPHYTCSHLYPDIPLGGLHPKSGIRCEDLERLTYPDGSFDLFVTQDVLEHVFDAEAVFRQISRVLRPGGLHVFTVPLVNQFGPTEERASRLPSGEVEHHMEPVYHGNPIARRKGSLMTWNWGYDIAERIAEWTGMRTVIVQVQNLDAGICAELTEVVVSRKP